MIKNFKKIVNTILKVLPDKMLIQIKYRYYLGEWPNLSEPRNFNEKLQWLKLYDRKPEYTNIVDKYKVREFVSSAVGAEYLIPLLGVWEKYDDIDFKKLPEQFVLKPNHTSGDVFICKDKLEIDYNELKKEVDGWLKKNLFWKYREWPYKDIRPLILCEELLTEEIIDYKFYCFNGIPKFLYISQGLVKDHSLKVDFLDLSWEKMPFFRTDYERLNNKPQVPKRFKEMIELSRKLSKNFSFVRVDLYEKNDQVFFSELTLYPTSGFMNIEPKEYIEIIGDWISLPKNND